MSSLPLQFLLVTIAGWMTREQGKVVAYLLAENEVLRAQVHGKRVRFSDAQRRKLARAAKALRRRERARLNTLVTPETLLRWYRRLVANKYDGSAVRGPAVRRRTADIVELVVRIARENPNWGYTRIRGALSKLGYEIGRNTIKRILIEAGIPHPSAASECPGAHFCARTGARSRPWTSSRSRCSRLSAWFDITCLSSSIWPAEGWMSRASFASPTMDGCGRSRAT